MGRSQFTHRFGGALIALALLAAGCTTHEQNTPPLTGPSELSTSITITLSPDVVTQDGASQSLVTIVARDQNGNPLRNQSLRVDTSVGGVQVDFGTLSARSVVTDANGRATVTYTAPQAAGTGVPATNVEIVVTPTGGDFGNAAPRTATVRVVPSGVIVPPRGSVTAAFAATSANDNEPVVFNATQSTSTTGTIVQWLWNFGDGSAGSGEIVQHTYRNGGTFPVTLTVIDSIGASNSTTQNVTVTTVNLNPPTVVTSPPSGAVVGQTVFFSSTTTNASDGHRVVSYAWDFGDGTSASGQNTTHAYTTTGQFTVRLTITDERGHTGTATQTIQVATDEPIARIGITPANPQTNSQAIFDASTSTAAAGRTIVSYQWTFSDNGSLRTSNDRTVTRNVGGTPGTFVATLTVTDNTGRTGTTTQTYTVTTPAIGGGT